MENIKKCTKKLKEYFIPNMIETLVSMQNNINIKKQLSKSILDFTDEKMINQNKIIFHFVNLIYLE